MGETKINARIKLLRARELLINQFLSEIYEIILDDDRPILTIKFRKGFMLYIRYNDFDEYSYQILFSQKKFDRIRYDNYDDKWNVSSKPHHFHPRNKQTALESRMIGKPGKDIPVLIQILKELL
ncbi:MAG: hypothetical protein KAX09_03360 [Candidatus Heimdallarchaeota archaeon]|nr:hypothetical protein [Candidatus Heimdallarchaeota archaeon]MCK4289997.1 hypothetical protein [Candidatus Heimdallarchaeota archaeon]